MVLIVFLLFAFWLTICVLYLFSINEINLKKIKNNSKNNIFNNKKIEKNKIYYQTKNYNYVLNNSINNNIIKTRLLLKKIVKKINKINHEKIINKLFFTEKNHINNFKYLINNYFLLFYKNGQNDFYYKNNKLNYYNNFFNFNFEINGKKIDLNSFIFCRYNTLIYYDKYCYIKIKLNLINNILSFDFLIRNFTNKKTPTNFNFTITNDNFTPTKNIKINLKSKNLPYKNINKNNSIMKISSHFLLSKKINFYLKINFESEIIKEIQEKNKTYNFILSQLDYYFINKKYNLPTNFSQKDYNKIINNCNFYYKNKENIIFFTIFNDFSLKKYNFFIFLKCITNLKWFNFCIILNIDNQFERIVNKINNTNKIKNIKIYENDKFPKLLQLITKNTYLYKLNSYNKNALQNNTLNNNYLENIKTINLYEYNIDNLNAEYKFDFINEIIKIEVKAQENFTLKFNNEDLINIYQIKNYLKIIDKNYKSYYIYFNTKIKLKFNEFYYIYFQDENTNKNIYLEILISNKSISKNTIINYNIIQLPFKILSKKNEASIINDLQNQLYKIIKNNYKYNKIIWWYFLLYNNEINFKNSINHTLKNKKEKLNNKDEFLLIYLIFKYSKIYNKNIKLFNFDFTNIILSLINLPINDSNIIMQYCILNELKNFIINNELNIFIKMKLNKINNILKNNIFSLKYDDFYNIFWNFIYFFKKEIKLDIIKNEILFECGDEHLFKYEYILECNIFNKIKKIKLTYANKQYKINELNYLLEQKIIIN